MNQIALTGTITHLYLWRQQPGRRAKKGWVWVIWGRGPEHIGGFSQKTSRGNHSHLILITCLVTTEVSSCWNQRCFTFWAGYGFVHLEGLSLLCPRSWFASSPSLSSSCIKHPGSTLFEPNKHNKVFGKIEEEMMGGFLISEAWGCFVFKLSWSTSWWFLLDHLAGFPCNTARFIFNSGSWTLGHKETAVMKVLE